MSAFVEYKVWRRQHGSSSWSMTSHTLKARSEKEASSKLRKRFAGAGFHNMTLIALTPDKTPI